MIRAENQVGLSQQEKAKCNPRDEEHDKKHEGQQPGQLVATTTFKANANSCSVGDTSHGIYEYGPCWDGLPSVILLEIFSYLSEESRIKASQVCRNWRYALFHPSFWKKITFALKDDDSVIWARFLSSCFGLSVREVTIRCESAENCGKEAMDILKKLSSNRQLRKLVLEPSSCTFEWPSLRMDCDEEGRLYFTPLMNSLLNIIETSLHLEVLSLGCIEELTANASFILKPLQHHHAKHLTHLCLASVKDDPEQYDFLELDNSLFRSFLRLTVLTLDYDYVNDDLLYALDNGWMERLVIHVHGWQEDYPDTSNVAWISFTQKNPRCELRLNLIHSYMAVKVLNSHILQPAMPLTHLKVLFCENVNTSALHQLSEWYPKTLRSLIWIDSINPPKNLLDAFNYTFNRADPLVLAAWRCEKLEEIVFIGQKYMLDNLLAIVRLRQKKIKRLEVAESDIMWDEPMCQSKLINDEICEVIGKHWKPLSNNELPKVVTDPLSGDSREVILPMVLCDQK